MTHTTTAPATELVALLYPDLSRELNRTRRTLERFPDDKAGWQPHQKSKTIEALAAHIAMLPTLAAHVLGSDALDVSTLKARPVSSRAAELLQEFDDGVARLEDALARTTSDHLAAPWTLRSAERVMASGPRREMLRELLINHGAHHRAQLGVYYRLLDLPVPGIYGPSADEA